MGPVSFARRAFQRREPQVLFFCEAQHAVQFGLLTGAEFHACRHATCYGGSAELRVTVWRRAAGP